MAKNKEIKKPHLLLCEGMDATIYVIELLQFFIKQNAIFEDYQALDFGGVADLDKYLATLKTMDGYERVKTIVVIRDAENDANGAIQSIVSAFRNNSFACPPTPITVSETGTPRIGFVLFPSCNEILENGTLEDLCLRNLSKENAADILSKIDALIKGFHFKRPHKNRLYTYFSLTDDYVALKIGEAARARAFDFTCPAIESLRRFLSRNLSNA